jgi:membrane protein DedA with SNARE-associated domain
VLDISWRAGYVGVALLVGSESAGLPVPGETSLIAAAVLASQHHLSLPLVIVVGAVAAIVGDNLGYFFGRNGGRRLLQGSARRRRLLAQGEAFFERHGPKAVFLGRWVPWLRITAAWLAGASRMRWPRFLVWNALGGAAWATSVAVAAYVLGKAASAVLGGVGLALLVLVAVGGAVVLLLRRRRSSAPTAARSRA